MLIGPGARVGPYEILGLLGAGGMGEVYRARDTRLPRDVAIKVLPADVAADPSRRQRFEREARAVSQLSHPHICQLFDVGDADGRQFLVMEYLDGQTLAERLRKGRLPFDQALQYAIQIADALDAAHRSGIIHRDLKPGNIMLTKAGVKLLDFGIAKMRAPVGAGVDVPDGTAGTATLDGALVGTLHYMAPEQLEGREADARSDLFAFGAVVYEMLTGRRAFAGESQSSVIAAVLDSDPPAVTASQPLAPPIVDHIVTRCLAKDPDERWQTAADLKRELQWAGERPRSASSQSVTDVPRRPSPSMLRWAAVGVVLGAILAGATAWTLKPAAEVTRTLIDVTPAEGLRSHPFDAIVTDGRPSRTALALSPDGRTLVFSGFLGGVQLLYARNLDELEARPIPGTEGGNSPFFSPDGDWLGFWSPLDTIPRARSLPAGILKKVPLSGGPPVPICDARALFGAAWGPGGTILFAEDRGGLLQVSADGGSPRPLTALNEQSGEASHRLPHVLPDGRTVLFTVRHTVTRTSRGDDTQIAVYSPDTDLHRILLDGAADARYVPSGHLLFVRAGTLVAVPFDPDRLAVTGSEVGLLPDVMQADRMGNSDLDTGSGQFSTSKSGSLVYVPGRIVRPRPMSFVWVDRSGTLEGSPIPNEFASASIAPDGKRLVGTLRGQVWVFDLSGAGGTQLTSEGGSFPIWTHDGTRVTFASRSGGTDNLFWQPADGSGRATRMLPDPEHIQTPGDWSRNGDLVFIRNPQAGGGSMDIWVLPAGKNQAQPLLETRFAERYPTFSPDGGWLAYVSDELGREEVFVRPYPGDMRGIRISVNGGTEPAWSRDGRELFYRDMTSRPGWTRMMTADMEDRDSFAFGPPIRLFEAEGLGGRSPIRGYDVAADGRFLIRKFDQPLPSAPHARIVLVLNWFEELKRRVPVD